MPKTLAVPNSVSHFWRILIQIHKYQIRYQFWVRIIRIRRMCHAKHFHCRSVIFCMDDGNTGFPEVGSDQFKVCINFVYKKYQCRFKYYRTGFPHFIFTFFSWYFHNFDIEKCYPKFAALAGTALKYNGSIH